MNLRLPSIPLGTALLLPGALLLAISSPHVHSEEEIANFGKDYNFKQKTNGWEYGFCEATTKYDFQKDFIVFPHIGPLKPNITGGKAQKWHYSQEDWVSLWRGFMHPGSEDQPGRHDGVSRWPILRWVSTTSGKIRITGEFGKKAIKDGDGVNYHIFQDGEELLSGELDRPGSDPFDIPANVKAGTCLDFRVSPSESDWSDTTKLKVVIYGEGGAVMPPPSGQIPLLSQLNPASYHDPEFREIPDTEFAVKWYSCLSTIYVMLEHWQGNTNKRVEDHYEQPPGEGAINKPDYVSPGTDEKTFDAQEIARLIEEDQLPVILVAIKQPEPNNESEKEFHYVLAHKVLRSEGELVALLANDPLPNSKSDNVPGDQITISLDQPYPKHPGSTLHRYQFKRYRSLTGNPANAPLPE